MATTIAALLHTLRMRLDPPDYTLRTTINPLPGPERGFTLRVADRRGEGRDARSRVLTP